jgi:hypothetical protein
MRDNYIFHDWNNFIEPCITCSFRHVNKLVTCTECIHLPSNKEAPQEIVEAKPEQHTTGKVVP